MNLIKAAVTSTSTLELDSRVPRRLLEPLGEDYGWYGDVLSAPAASHPPSSHVPYRADVLQAGQFAEPSGGRRVAQPDGSAISISPPRPAAQAKEGYKPDGETCQPSVHAPHFTDKRIVRAIFETGTLAVKIKNLLNSKWRTSQNDGRRALPKTHWQPVLAAAVARSSLLQVIDDEVHIKPVPDDNNLKIKYNEELVELCDFTLKEFLEAMHDAASTQDGRKRRRQD